MYKFRYLEQNSKTLTKPQVLNEFNNFDVVQSDVVLEEFLGSQTPAVLGVLNLILNLANSFSDVYPRQDTIARYAGISVRHCSNALNILRDAGLIASKYRHMKSCLYKVAPLFFDVDIRARLAPMLKALMWFPLVLLTISQQNFIDRQNSFKDEHCRQLKYKRLRYSNIYGKFRSTNEGSDTENVCQQILTSSSKYLIPPEINNISHKLNLSLKGEVGLTAFSPAVLSYANEKLTKTKLAALQRTRRADPYAWVAKVCRDRSEREGILPNWRWAYQLDKALDLPGRASMYIKQKRLHPLFKGLQYKKEDPARQKKNLETYSKSDASSFMKQLIGSEAEEKIISNITRPLCDEKPVIVEPRSPNDYWRKQFAQYRPKE